MTGPIFLKYFLVYSKKVVFKLLHHRDLKLKINVWSCFQCNLRFRSIRNTILQMHLWYRMKRSETWHIQEHISRKIRSLCFDKNKLHQISWNSILKSWFLKFRNKYFKSHIFYWNLIPVELTHGKKPIV